MTRPIRYQPRWVQLPWYMLLVPLPYAVGGLLLDGRNAGFMRWTALFMTAGHAGVLAFVRTTGVELHRDALIMRGVRRRVIPWHEIGWIGPAPMLGTHLVGIRVGGRMLRLRAPAHTRFLGPDPEFEAKAGMIYDYWVRHRGPDWQPSPPDGWATPRSEGFAP